jgi:hypothetical protein
MIKKVSDWNQLSRLVLRGYKSVAECDIELGKLNVLIGANGAGKSNFIGFFRLINRILDRGAGCAALFWPEENRRATCGDVFWSQWIPVYAQAYARQSHDVCA